jgi:hypothetical protein
MYNDDDFSSLKFKISYKCFLDFIIFGIKIHNYMSHIMAYETRLYSGMLHNTATFISRYLTHYYLVFNE